MGGATLHLMSPEPLTDQQQLILQLVKKHPRSRAALLEDAREQLGLSVTRFWQEALRIARSESGWAHDPITCRRILRLTGSRYPWRAAG